nr:MAG TPA: Glucose-6-phosphate 1-dehydrogenase [Caudoviricetes sp.]
MSGVRVLLFAHIEIWCNGNTADFGSAIQGSNPCISTNGVFD